MKRVQAMLLVVVCILLFSGQSLVFATHSLESAAARGAETQIEPLAPAPRYDGVKSILVTLGFDGNKALPAMIMSPDNNNPADTVKVNVRLIREGTSKPVKTWNQTLGLVNNRFCFAESYAVSARGNYYFESTIKCYQNGKLIDTIDVKSVVKKY